jgi:SAM-dependent methyltransferase
MHRATYRNWEYNRVGDYHRNLDPNWSYTPTYLKKMAEVRRFVDDLSKDASILDAGCGEGVLVEQLERQGRCIRGIDLNYESDLVMRGNVLNMPYDDMAFDAVLLLDVIEHLSYVDQPKALSEIHRVLKNRGSLFLSAPNMGHLNSRASLFFHGTLDRTDIEENHPGERPLAENTALLRNSGFDVVKIRGITLTIPFVYRRVICASPARFRRLHDWLNLFAVPTLAMINIFLCRKR